ncbi:MAG TPA: lytic transglycosylase domain-containing protein [Longimicrobiales bacterium]
MSSALLQWEQENIGPLRRLVGEWRATLRRPAWAALFGTTAFLLGIYVASAPWSPLADVIVRQRLESTQVALKARQGELELARLELARIRNVMDYSAKFEIPADLASAIYDIALAEGIDPELGFNLVRVESGFFHRAVSPVGAVGLAQLMPKTAFELDPSLGYSDLFDRETNLRLGFRYLRQLLEKYDGDLRLALLAYNRGPGTVDRIRRNGGDPANGYARAVLGAN